MVNVYDFFWDEINMDVVAIKAFGNYEQFISEYFARGNDTINIQTLQIKTYKQRFKELLEAGKCIYRQHYLIFKKGFETEYADYVFKYIQSRNNESMNLTKYLKEDSSFSKIKAYVELFHQGIILKEELISTCGSYFKTENALKEYLEKTI